MKNLCQLQQFQATKTAKVKYRFFLFTQCDENKQMLMYKYRTDI